MSRWADGGREQAAFDLPTKIIRMLLDVLALAAMALFLGHLTMPALLARAEQALGFPLPGEGSVFVALCVATIVLMRFPPIRQRRGEGRTARDMVQRPNHPDPRTSLWALAAALFFMLLALVAPTIL